MWLRYVGLHIYIYIYMMRELTLREKQAIWMLNEKRKSVKTVKMNLIDVSVKSPTTWWKCHQTNWEVLHIASEQWPKTPCQLSQGVYKGKEMESLRLPKSISRFKSDWTWVSPAEEESKGRNSQNKQQLELAALKDGESVSKNETRWCLWVHRLPAVIVHKGSATKW